MTLNENMKRYGFIVLNMRFYLAVATGCFLLTGCAITEQKNNQPEASLESIVKEANDELAKGRREQAIAILNQAARENPVSMIPWLRIANIWFDAANYPSSILAANEVLQRDATNQEAKSILVVAGLRVAAGAVTGLRSSNPVNSNARAEAEKLTQSLRAALGEKILVPATEPEVKQVPPGKKKIIRRYKRATAPARSIPSNANADRADPFKSLK